MKTRPLRAEIACRRLNVLSFKRLSRCGLRLVIAGLLAAAVRGFCADSSDPLIDILLEKGLLTQAEAEKVKALAEARRTNAPPALPPIETKWKINKAIKSVELFGDLRFRYENRQAFAPSGGKVELDRGRFSVRIGLRGDAFDDVYYGLRLDTASNPRSPWVTFGTSSSGIPYQGPFGKSTGGVDIGQVFLGWRPEPWVDITVGKMPNPLFTTPMVWDSDLSPEGAAERFKYTVGQADFFATFGQFLYADNNPSTASYGLGFVNSSGDELFQLAWQGGVTYRFTTNISAKVGTTLYNYIGLDSQASPYFGNTFVGEGSYAGPASSQTINGFSGYGASSSFLNYPSQGFPNNQVGLDHLLVLEIPFEVNFKFPKFDAKVFGDVAYNLDGAQRAEAAAAGYDYFLGNYSSSPATISGFSPQIHDVKAYQFGFAVGSKDSLGLVYGTTSRKNAWEFRTYWQHVEQYALDPNLLDSDFFEGRGNLEGIYSAFAYSFTDNLLGTVRYGYAARINNRLGTGGSNQDIPQVNPIDHYELLQMDLSFRF